MPKKSWKKCHKFQEIGATKTHVGCIGVSRQNTTKMQTVHLRKSVMGCCYIVIACGTYEYKWKTVNVLRQKLRALPGTTDWASLALENTADNQRPNHLRQATSNSRTNDQWTHKKKQNYKNNAKQQRQFGHSYQHINERQYRWRQEIMQTLCWKAPKKKNMK